jgi:hypothetical protein
MVTGNFFLQIFNILFPERVRCFNRRLRRFTMKRDRQPDGLEVARDAQSIIATGDIGALRRLLRVQPGLLFEVVGTNQATALHLAARHDKAHMIRLLLDLGAPVEEATNDWGTTPLIRAAGNNSTAALAALLEAGAAPNGRNRRGKTALHYAASTNATAVVKALVAFGGCAIDARSAVGSTPLMHAADSGAIGALRALVAAGAEIEAQDALGMSALSAAIVENQSESVAELLELGAELSTATLDTYFVTLCAASAPNLGEEYLAVNRARCLKRIARIGVPQLASKSAWLQCAIESCALDNSLGALDATRAVLVALRDAAWTPARCATAPPHDRRSVFAMLLTFGRLGLTGRAPVQRSSSLLDPCVGALRFTRRDWFLPDRFTTEGRLRRSVARQRTETVKVSFLVCTVTFYAILLTA